MSQGVFLFNNKYELMDTIPAKDLTENYLDAELNGLITGGFTTTDIRDYDIYDYFGIKEENNFWLFKIRSVVKDRDRIRVHGIHIMFDELQGKILRDVKPRNAEVNTVLLNMLNETGWQAGFVVTSSKFSGSFYFQSALSALYELCAKAKCEFEPVIKFSDGKIISKTINVYDQISDDYGKLFKYGDNLLKVVAETNTDTLATRFIGRGKGEQSFDENGNPTGGFGRKIRFDTIDYTNTKDGITVNSPKGQDYIDIDKYKDLYSYPDGRPREIVIDFDDIEDRKELADATFEYALENCRPKVQLKASGLQYEKVELGETVTIIGQMDIRYKTRVFKIKKDFLREKVVSFEFGDKLVKTMADRIKQGQMAEKEREITEQNYMKAMIAMVESSFYNEDGYQYDLKTDNEYDLPAGFYSFNKPIDENPTKVIYFGAGKLMIANSKKGDGSWDFSVAIDGDAVNANVIRAGILRGGRVKWDLQNGTFLIGKSKDDYNFYWDGTTLHLRNVDIDLSNNYQIQDINNNINSVNQKISGVDSKLDNSISGLDAGISNLKSSVDTTIKRIDSDISNVDSKVDSNKQELVGDINSLSSSVDESIKDLGVRFDTVDEKITILSQDFKLGNGEMSSTINARIDGLANVVKGNQEDFESYKLNNVKVIGDIRSEIKQTESSIETSIASQIQTVNDRMDSKDTAIRNYVKTNYSTTLQTEEKIKSTVASEVKAVNADLINSNANLKEYVETNFSTKEQTDTAITSKVASEVRVINTNLSNNYDTKTEVDAKIKSADNSLKSYISSNYSTTSQTDSKIASKVASEIKTVNDRIDSKDSSLRTYVSNNYSTKTQTSNLIESKVSSVTSDVSGLKSRMSTAESKISQTSSEISTKVSKNGVISSINQSSESIKINASKIDLQGDVTLTGRFKTFNGSKRALDMHNSSIDMYDQNNSNALMGSIAASSTLTVQGNYAYSRPVLRLSHDSSGLAIINQGINGDTERDYYMIFDKNEHIAYHNNHPIVMYQNTMVRGTLTVGDTYDSNRQNNSNVGTIKIGKWELKAYFDTFSLYYRDELVYRWTR